MMRPWTLAALSFAACHAVPSSSGAVEDDTSRVAPPLDRDGPRPRIELTWRLFETQRWLEGRGEKRESAVVELLVNGGNPARVDLGRHDTAGCAVRVATSTPYATAPTAALTSVDCLTASVQVFRASADEIRVVAADLDGARAGGSTPAHVKTVMVHIPADADVAVDRELPRIPDEAPGL